MPAHWNPDAISCDTRRAEMRPSHIRQVTAACDDARCTLRNLLYLACPDGGQGMMGAPHPGPQRGVVRVQQPGRGFEVELPRQPPETTVGEGAGVLSQGLEAPAARCGRELFILAGGRVARMLADRVEAMPVGEDA